MNPINPHSIRSTSSVFAIASLATCALLPGVLATPTGLNNIPTADTVPHRTVAVQVFDTVGDGPHDFWSGFKTGWDFSKFNLEWGLDSHLAPDPAGPLYFQTKANFSPWEDGLIAVGVASVALSDSERAGDPFSYAILSQDLGLARLHAGYGLQNDGNTVLLGIDRTVKVLERNLNLNADLIQTGDGDGWLTALGVKYDLNEFLVFESWVNLPDEGEASVMLKLNFVFTY
ncbi:MAG: hypothetical protein KDM63_05990 [Verrucomicrobiae bacterium]|nr:hypothetical protein [Verrucomicrobiae bacterium]